MTRWVEDRGGPSDRAAHLDRLEAIRDMFPRCRYCGGQLEFTPLERVVLVQGEDRLAHRRCVPSEEVPGQAAWHDAVRREV